MKPDWNNAPPWADWWVIDEGDGDSFAEVAWSEFEPYLIDTFEYAYWGIDKGRFEYDYSSHYTGEAYKEQRP